MYDRYASTKLYNTLMGNPTANNAYNAVGRTAGASAASGSDDNFFVKRGKSIENALGTTGAAIASDIKSGGVLFKGTENIATDQLLKDTKNSMNDIAKKYGYNTWADWQDAYAEARNSGNTDLINQFKTQLKDFQAQANTNADKANKKAADYRDYTENNYVSEKINQDPGKFLGSSMNTLSTGADVLTMAAGIPTSPLVNAGQGAWEGIADELEQNGFENYDWGRAGQNAAIGATTGLVTGAINKGVNNKLMAKGGNYFKGGNAFTKAINTFNETNPVGKTLSTIGSGAARGMQSGLVGGAVGAGLSSAINQEDIGQGIQNTIQGAVKGAGQGAIAGGTMAGANLAANAALNKFAPDTAKAVRENQLQNASYGDKLRDQFKGAWNSGDSAVANNYKTLVNNLRGDVPANNTAISATTPQMDGSWQDIDTMVDRSIAEAMPEADVAKVKDTVIENVANKLQDSGILEGHEAGQIPDGDYRNYVAAALNDTLAEMSEAPSTQQNTKVTNQAQATTNNQNLSPWDRVAQEGGYASYDDAVQSFMQANPGVEVGPNDAGKILTWMDKNPGNWNPNAPQTTRNAQTEVYETLNGKKGTTSEVPTSKQIKNKRLLVEEITKQFNAVDKPTTRATKPNETFYNLYENWGLSDGDEIRQAVSYADQGALIPQMVREAAGEVGIIDLADAQGMVMDLKINKAASSKMINALENIMDSTDTTIVGGKQGIDALQFQRTLEQMASDARGSNGTYHIGNTVVDETMARNFDRIAKNIGNKLDEAAVSKGVVQNVLNRHAGDIQDMKNAFPNNQKWQDSIDTKILGAKNIGDLRHSMKDLVRANIYIENGDENFGSFGGRYAANSDIPTSKATIRNKAANWLWDKLQESSPARKARLERYDKGMRVDTTTATQAPTNIKNTANNVNSAPSYNAGTPNQLYNAIGRTEGLTNGEQARTAGYITDATQSMNAESGYMAPLGVSQTTPANTTLESLATPASTAVYNTLYETPTTATQTSTAVGYFQPTGDYWTDVLAKAVTAAIDNNDVQAFSSLYSMYQDAVSDLQKEANSNSAANTKLTDKQRQANAAARALEDFEQAESNFGYDVSDIPILGNVANFGGNEYLSKAEALALQIGYMLSGATINKDEAKKIGMAYVPQPRENAAARQSKLNQLRGIIADYQRTYAE